jgi:hypothetical protein
VTKESLRVHDRKTLRDGGMTSSSLMIGFGLTRYLVNQVHTPTLGTHLSILRLIPLKALTFDLRAWATWRRLIPIMQTTWNF